LKERTALFAGTFDPPTMGHVNIIERAAKLYDRLYVIVAHNISKKCLFSAEERRDMVLRIVNDYKLDNVEVVIYEGLIVNFAKTHHVNVMIRGVRSLSDFSYEFELAMTNKQIQPKLETLFMPTDPKYFSVRSSQIKEMARFGADISNMVPKFIVEQVLDKLAAEKQ
jgi:pantetheine-phosphate adenylyltransferase, bacterial